MAGCPVEAAPGVGGFAWRLVQQRDIRRGAQDVGLQQDEPVGTDLVDHAGSTELELLRCAVRHRVIGRPCDAELQDVEGANAYVLVKGGRRVSFPSAVKLPELLMVASVLAGIVLYTKVPVSDWRLNG